MIKELENSVFLNWLDFLRFYTVRFPRDSTHDENGINHVKKNKLLSFSQRKMLFMNIVDNEKNFLSSSFFVFIVSSRWRKKSKGHYYDADLFARWLIAQTPACSISSRTNIFWQIKTRMFPIVLYFFSNLKTTLFSQ